MKKHIDVAALGELLVDFTCNGASAQGNPFYEANPGGAPCNVLAMLAKLDKKTAFIGKVGEDQFGHLLRQVGLEAGISMDSLVMDPPPPWPLSKRQKTATGTSPSTGTPGRTRSSLRTKCRRM